MNPTITNVSDMGKLIELSDQSKWEIDPMHNLKSSLWMAGDEIAMVSSGNAFYPFILVNIRNVECVTAKRSGT